jgi:hypothetical protein
MTLIDEIPPDPRRLEARGRRWGGSGEYCCDVCGYRILGHGELPDCPMCHQHAWRLVAWRPFSPPGGAPLELP